MSGIILTVSIPQTLFDWLEQAVAAGEYASVDSVIATAVERLRSTEDYLAQLDGWAAEFSQSGLARLAEASTPYLVDPYDDAYFAASDELFSPMTVPPGTTVDISGFAPD